MIEESDEEAYPQLVKKLQEINEWIDKESPFKPIKEISLPDRTHLQILMR
ncbi:MAG: hypothetical protein GXO71_02035 [Caldiserica bacterium]|nr:hypothetical protein [Caldisericota bacterium]